MELALEARSLWTRIVNALIKHLTFHTLLMMGFIYTLPLNSDNLLMFWNTFHMDWFGLITFTFTIYIVLYDWWLDPGQSRSQAVILCVWILGV